ncbi:hypothetical protein GPECTOR_33g550 [Gonium pectorale]|uniref:Uncharacterized protein n=1 Tax=Gonium pectorale TaxID=33097 RepID=A0A150GCX0_GONPE|nr:hypothetical protein GPECTOR_33g550 [Gonium pectorale]|eukprot:KXZ47668.1 hypothetical protein GPECTOR_33g550 [Gonium pectorale]
MRGVKVLSLDKAAQQLQRAAPPVGIPPAASPAAASGLPALHSYQAFQTPKPHSHVQSASDHSDALTSLAGQSGQPLRLHSPPQLQLPLPLLPARQLEHMLLQQGTLGPAGARLNEAWEAGNGAGAPSSAAAQPPPAPAPQAYAGFQPRRLNRMYLPQARAAAAAAAAASAGLAAPVTAAHIPAAPGAWAAPEAAAGPGRAVEPGTQQVRMGQHGEPAPGVAAAPTGRPVGAQGAKPGFAGLPPRPTPVSALQHLFPQSPASGGPAPIPSRPTSHEAQARAAHGTPASTPTPAPTPTPLVRQTSAATARLLGSISSLSEAAVAATAAAAAAAAASGCSSSSRPGSHASHRGRQLSDFAIPEDEPLESTVSETVAMMRMLSQARGAHLSSRIRRVRITAKIQSSHPERLPSDLPSRLAGAALSAGGGGLFEPPPAVPGGARPGGVWLLTGVAARRGCVELVFEMVQVEGGVEPPPSTSARRRLPSAAHQLHQQSGSRPFAAFTTAGSGLSAASGAEPPPPLAPGRAPSRSHSYRRWQSACSSDLSDPQLGRLVDEIVGGRALASEALGSAPPGHSGAWGAGFRHCNSCGAGSGAASAGGVTFSVGADVSSDEAAWLRDVCGLRPEAVGHVLEQCGLLNPYDDPWVEIQVGQAPDGAVALAWDAGGACGQWCVAGDGVGCAGDAVAASRAAATGAVAGLEAPTLWLPSPIVVLTHGSRGFPGVRLASWGAPPREGEADEVLVRSAASYLPCRTEPMPRGGAADDEAAAAAAADGETCRWMVLALDALTSRIHVAGGLLWVECRRSRALSPPGGGSAASAPAVTSPGVPLLVLPAVLADVGAELQHLKSCMSRLMLGPEAEAVGGEGEPGAAPAAEAAEVEMACQQLLADLGALLDAAAVTTGATTVGLPSLTRSSTSAPQAFVESVAPTAAAVAAAGISTSAGSCSPGPVCVSFEHGMRVLLHGAAVSDGYGAGGGDGTAAGPYAEHMADLACTVLAGCLGAGLPQTAALVLRLACAPPLALAAPEVLLAEAGADPRVAADLLASLQPAAAAAAFGSAEGASAEADARPRATAAVAALMQGPKNALRAVLLGHPLADAARASPFAVTASTGTGYPSGGGPEWSSGTAGHLALAIDVDGRRHSEGLAMLASDSTGGPPGRCLQSPSAGLPRLQSQSGAAAPSRFADGPSTRPHPRGTGRGSEAAEAAEAATAAAATTPPPQPGSALSSGLSAAAAREIAAIVPSDAPWDADDGATVAAAGLSDYTSDPAAGEGKWGDGTDVEDRTSQPSSLRSASACSCRCAFPVMALPGPSTVVSSVSSCAANCAANCAASRAASRPASPVASALDSGAAGSSSCRSSLERRSPSGAAAAGAAAVAEAAGWWPADAAAGAAACGCCCCCCDCGTALAPAGQAAGQPLDLGPWWVLSFRDPDVEAEYWRFVAQRTHGVMWTFFMYNLFTSVVSCLRAYLEDGLPGAASFMLFSGSQAAALVAAGVACKAFRVAADVLMGCGLMAVPSLMQAMAVRGVEVCSEAFMRPIGERVPFRLFLLLLALELPAVWLLYRHFQTIYPRFWLREWPLLRTLAYAALAFLVMASAELYWRREFRLWRRSLPDAGRGATAAAAGGRGPRAAAAEGERTAAAPVRGGAARAWVGVPQGARAKDE